MNKGENEHFRSRRSPVLQNTAEVNQLSEDVPLLKSQKKILDRNGNDRKLMTWEEIDEWQQHNRFIIKGYRQATNSYLKSITSLTYIHNQTFNIYSHLLGAVVFMISSYVLYQAIASQYITATWTDFVVFACFFSGLFFCLLCSTCFHTFSNHSDDIYHSVLLMDLVGIVCLITGSFYPGVYYGFYCEPEIIYTYWAMITTFGVGAIVACLLPELRKPAWRHVPTAMFLAMGLSGVLPMTHAAVKFGISQVRHQMGWIWYAVEGILYVSGAVFYVTLIVDAKAKIPERFSPGRFDIWGSSHQIFHIFVLLGAASHLTGAIQGFDYNHNPDTARC